MSILDKAMFWKKKEDDLGGIKLPDFAGSLTPLENTRNTGLPNMDTALPPMPPHDSAPSRPAFAQESSLSMPQSQSPYAQQFPSPQQQSSPVDSKDIQLISVKLDVIKAELDNISQRLARLEKMAEGEVNKW